MRYEFDKGLHEFDRLELLAMDPAFDLLCRQLPQYGVRTKRAATNTKGIMLFGAASVLCKNDRHAEAAFRRFWRESSDLLEEAGIRVTPKPPTASSWRYYRSTYLSGETTTVLREAFTELMIHVAREMGLFGTPTEPWDWMRPDHRYTVFGDATWMKAASEVGHTRRSRAKKGSPRIVHDAEKNGNGFGYQHTVLFARVQGEERMRLILDLQQAPRNVDGTIAVEMVTRLHRVLGDSLRYLVYDRGVKSFEHYTQVMALGVAPLTKADCLHAFGDWAKRIGTPKEKNELTFTMTFDGCSHQLVATVGMLWDLQPNHAGKPILTKPLTHRRIDRYKRADGSYGFTVELGLDCGDRTHVFTLDVTEPLRLAGRPRPVKLANHLGLIPAAEGGKIRQALNIRQNAESMFSYLKNHLNFGERAGSFTVRDHEIDLLLISLLHNACVYAEYRERQRDADLKAA